MNNLPLFVSLALVSLGLMAMLTRKTILGVLLGFQMTSFGMALLAVYSAKEIGSPVRGQILGMILLLGSLIPLIGGFSFSVRLFYLRTKATIEELEELKG